MLSCAGAAVLGALLVICACVLPFVTSGQASVSIFSSGGSGWLTVEPIVVALLALAAGAVIMAAARTLVPAVLGLVAAGGLIGIGIQTLMLFAGYQFGTAVGGTAGPGGLVGMFAALVLIAAGVVYLVKKMGSAGAAS